MELSGGSTLVPDLVNQPYEEARTTLSESTLTEGKVLYQDVPDAAQAGLVLAQAPAAGTLAMLDAPITLTVGRLAKAYHGTIAFTVPQGVAPLRVRVVLLEDGQETVQYDQSVTADTDVSISVELGSDLPGPLTCRVYLDDTLLEEREVALE